MRYFILASFLIIALSFPATAEDKFDNQIFIPPGTDQSINNASLITRILKEQSLEKAQKYEVDEAEVTLVHFHYMEPDQFGIMLKVPNTLSGFKPEVLKAA